MSFWIVHQYALAMMFVSPCRKEEACQGENENTDENLEMIDYENTTDEEEDKDPETQNLPSNQG